MPGANPSPKTGTLANTLGALNPFRYRGYVYDEETGLYYLRSRYYNPVWGRFINADSLLGKPGQLLGHNVFAYCNNTPIALYDSNGYGPAWVNELWNEPELTYAFWDLKPMVRAMHWPLATSEPEKDALRRIDRNLSNIIDASAATGTPVPMIGAVLFREIICLGIEDATGDWLPGKSRGIAQIKIATARAADEYFGLTTYTDSRYSSRLFNDKLNIYYCALVLKYEAAKQGWNISSLTRNQVQEVFYGYNGGKDYALTVITYYDAFLRHPLD